MNANEMNTLDPTIVVRVILTKLPDTIAALKAAKISLGKIVPTLVALSNDGPGTVLRFLLNPTTPEEVEFYETTLDIVHENEDFTNDFAIAFKQGLAEKYDAKGIELQKMTALEFVDKLLASEPDTNLEGIFASMEIDFEKGIVGLMSKILEPSGLDDKGVPADDFFIFSRTRSWHREFTKKGEAMGLVDIDPKNMMLYKLGIGSSDVTMALAKYQHLFDKIEFDGV